MKRIEKHLMAGETVVRQAHLHWIVYLPAICVAIVAIAGGGWLALQGPEERGGAAIGGGLLGFCAVWLALRGFIRRSSARFAVTNKRVLISLGLVRTRSIEMLLSQIEGITVHQDFWGRVFNYGTVIIEGTGGDGVPYRHIAAPGAFRLAVQEQIERYTKPAAPAGNEPSPRPDRYDELLRLDGLRAKGILTEDEFLREKRKLLG